MYSNGKARQLYDLPGAKKLFLIRFLLITSLILGSVYLFWRLMPYNWVNPLISLTLLVAEVIFFLSFVINIPILWMKKPTRKKYSVSLPQNISVDLVIPTYNESPNIINKTILAALKIKVPEGIKTRIFVLDDGSRDWLEFYVREVSFRTNIPVFYVRRSQRKGFKAGNINNYLFNCRPSDYFIVLDADHIPFPEILFHFLPYANDKAVGLVQAPQTFSNIEEGDPLGQNADFWFGVLQMGRYSFDSLICCGTPTFWQTDALLSIGGFAESVTEDFATGVALQARGWKVEYHPFEVAKGLASEDMEDVLRKTTRYSTGAFESFSWRKKMGKNQLKFMQKFLHFSYPLFFIMPLMQPVFILVPIVSIIFSYPPFTFKNEPVMLLVHILYLLSMQFALYLLSPKSFWRSWQFYIGSFPAYIEGFFRYFVKDKRFIVSNKEGKNGNSIFLVKYQLLAFIAGAFAFFYGTVILPPDGIFIRIPALFWIFLNNILLAGVLEVPAKSFVKDYVVDPAKIASEIRIAV